MKAGTNTNTKAVREAMKAHVISFFEADNEDPKAVLIDQAKSMIRRDHPTTYHTGRHMAEGGSFLIYNSEIVDFLNGLGINPTGKEFDDNKSFALYCHLCCLAVERICKR